MFLDDKLYELGKQCDPHDFESVKATCHKMIQECFSHIREKIKEGPKGYTLALIGQAIKSWEIASKRLTKDGYPIVKEDGFKIFLNSKPEFKTIIEEFFS